MRWHDFDRNGRIDGRDYFLLNELLNSEEEKENEDIFGEDKAEDSDDDLW